MGKRWTQGDINRLQKKRPVDGTKPGKIILPGPSSSVLTKAALKMLDLAGFQVWRQNNAGVYDNEKEVWRANSSTPGISDILGFRRSNGQFLACEIKAGRDRLSDDQIAFLDGVKEAGGVAIVIRTMDDIEAIKKLK
jgi:hypothetical protein